MKKVFSLIVALLLFVPILAKADLGAPEIRKYEAIVVKEGGIDYYKYNSKDKLEVAGHLDKDTKIIIVYEMYQNGTTYLEFQRDENDYGSLTYVKSSDVIPAEKEVSNKASGVDKLEKSVDIMVNAKDGVPVRKGPSEIYDIVGTLKDGTKGIYKYYIEDSAYIYVDMDGVSGWVNIENGAILENYGDYVVAVPIKLSCGTVPVGTVLKDVFFTDIWTGQSLIKYNDCEEMWNSFKKPNLLQLNKVKYAELLKNAELYDKPDGKVSMKLDKGTVVKILSDTFYGEDFDEQYGNDGAFNFYIFVEYKGNQYWLKEDCEEEELFKEVEKPADEPEEDPEEEKKEEEEEDKPSKKKKDKDDDEDDEEMLDSKTIIIICVVAGVAFALGALMTIILVNKRKKQNVVKEG